MSEVLHGDRLQHSLVLMLVLGGVAYVGYENTGGIDGMRHFGTQMSTTHWGLKNINISDNSLAAETSSIGTATVECLGDAPYSTDTVHRTGQNPNTYNVYVRKIGAGALDASSIEACIFDHTQLKTSVIQEHVK